MAMPGAFIIDQEIRCLFSASELLEVLSWHAFNFVARLNDWARCLKSKGFGGIHAKANEWE